MPPDGNVPREAAKDGPAKVRRAGEHLPVERALLVPRQGRESGVLLGRGEQVVFADDFDVVRLRGFGGELLNVFFVAGRGVDDGETLYKTGAVLVYLGTTFGLNVSRDWQFLERRGCGG